MLRHSVPILIGILLEATCNLQLSVILPSTRISKIGLKFSSVYKSWLEREKNGSLIVLLKKTQAIQLSFELRLTSLMN